MVLTPLLVIERPRSSLACPWAIVYLYVFHVDECFLATCLINVDFELQVACPVGACLVPRETGYDAALMGGQPRDSLGVACWRALL